ncbi:heat-shock protein HtpX [candidate division WOR-1 bacterium DG_54_3]|uniref:Protease HtpX homolog n=1 Tax=candidate division WOR-1 bacterium DG_54_3 TaxID=1703775 RepID=A0A0S7XXN6_UNCSA|nr:MAG: heat-shock protein HtpX [candidate division WOR-1 bacterium DG_54_3]
MIYEEIGVNKRRSFLLLFLFVAFLLFLGWVFGQAYGSGGAGVSVALLVALFISLITFYWGDKMVLGISHAKPVDRKENPYLANTVEGLAIAAGAPTPKAYIIEDSAPNAFATGRNPENSAIAVTTGLLDKLNRLELEGVVAHEMSHIKNYDIRYATLVVVLVGTVALLSDWMRRSFFYRGRGRKGRAGGGIIVLIALLLAILAPIVAQLIRLAISRQREYLADANGALLTRYPEGLASALEKISKDREPLEVANKATAHLYIVNPLLEHRGKINDLFSTHPPVGERIRRLRAM